MNNKIALAAGIFAAALVIAAIIAYPYLSPQSLSKNGVPARTWDTYSIAGNDYADQSNLDTESDGKEENVLVRVGSKVLQIETVGHSDVGGWAVLTDKAAGHEKVLGALDAGYEDEAIGWSPDRSHLFIASEMRLVVVEASTLTYRTVYEPQLGELHGLLTEFPSFIPKVRWTSNTTLEVSIYPEKLYTPEEQEAAIPAERRLISI